MYPGCEAELGGLKYTDAPAECDGDVVTGKGPGAVFDFAMMLARKLGLGEACETLYKGMFVERS